MVPHLLVIRKVPLTAEVATHGLPYVQNEHNSLSEDEQPELAVIKFADAASYPEAVVVELAHTFVAVVAVSRSIGQLSDTALVAATVLGYLKQCHDAKAWLRADAVAYLPGLLVVLLIRLCALSHLVRSLMRLLNIAEL